MSENRTFGYTFTNISTAKRAYPAHREIEKYLAFINTYHMVFMVTGKNSYFITFFILGQSNVTSHKAFKYHIVSKLLLLVHSYLLKVLELGIVVHSVVIGLSLGASNNTCTIKPLVAALCFHQMFEGMGLGGCILQDIFWFKFRGNNTTLYYGRWLLRYMLYLLWYMSSVLYISRLLSHFYLCLDVKT
ncbi:hypothetical protein Scep_030003 [Stephania cephalantha]|uniref:Uncharacterized protein n=1 Tax=Stephania cephalantha TaxID=152367 RepID=A0AAP0HG51_9MAGN